MSSLNIRPATVDDCAELSLNLRQADLTEIALGGSTGPYDALMRGLVSSEDAVVILGPLGDVVAMGGVVRITPTLGSPWLLGSEGLVLLKWPFLKECRSQLLALHQKYPLLHNQVWEGNRVHIRWLKWLGFTVGDHSTTRPHFLPFWKNNV